MKTKYKRKEGLTSGSPQTQRIKRMSFTVEEVHGVIFLKAGIENSDGKSLQFEEEKKDLESGIAKVSNFLELLLRKRFAGEQNQRSIGENTNNLISVNFSVDHVTIAD